MATLVAVPLARNHLYPALLIAYIVFWPIIPSSSVASISLSVTLPVTGVPVMFAVVEVRTRLDEVSHPCVEAACANP